MSSAWTDMRVGFIISRAEGMSGDGLEKVLELRIETRIQNVWRETWAGAERSATTPQA